MQNYQIEIPEIDKNKIPKKRKLVDKMDNILVSAEGK